MIHHKAENKEHERRIADALGKRWRCDVVEFPALSPVDYYVRRGVRLCALIEIKRKLRQFGQYPHIYLDVLKYWPMLSGSVAFSVPALYVVECLDGLYCVNVPTLIGLTVSVIGRRDRDDPLDVEPCIAIPIRLFKPIPVPAAVTEGDAAHVCT